MVDAGPIKKELVTHSWGDGRVAEKVGLGYLALSILWILTSDALVTSLPLSGPALQAVHSGKGCFFVGLSSLVLFFSLRTWERRAQQELRARIQTAEALGESEARFTQLADHIQEVFWLTDREKSDMLYVSPGYEKIWGRKCAELVKQPRTWLEAIHEQDRERVVQTLPLQSEGGYDLTYRILTPIGEVRWIRDRAFPVRNAQGQVFRIAGVAQDVTAQHETLLRLSESEERYRRVVDCSPDGILVYCEGRIVMANPALMRLLGAESGDTLMGRDPFDFIHPDDHPKVRAHIQLMEKSPEHRLFPEERRFFRLDGGLVTVERYAVPFVHEGKPAILVVLHDLTERKVAQLALDQQRRRLEAVVQSSLDGIVMLDSGGKVILFNPSAEAIFGRTLEEALGRNLADFIREPNPMRVGTGIRVVGLRRGEVSEGGAPSGNTRRGEVSEGGTPSENIEEFPLELTQARIELEEGFLWVLTCRDLTQTTLLEQQRTSLETQLRQAQKMEAVGKLAGGVAHDFNNLLTVMLGNLALLKTDSKANGEVLEDILRAVHRASDLTRQLLTFSRKQVMQPRQLDLNQVIPQVTKMLTRVLGEDIRVHTDLAPELPLIEADPGMMEQVLVNLAVNARDAMPAGGELWIETCAREVDDEMARDIILGVPGRFVCLSVSDNGSGIEPADLAHIFEPFFTTKEVGKGTGLGLATVYGIVEQHLGGLQVQSQPGEGSTFRLYFPARSGRDPQVVTTPTAISPGGQETILLVEDDPALLLLLNNVLKYAGYSVHTAASGVEALEVWEKHRDQIDLLMTDLVMPLGLNGVELARRLLEVRPQLKVLYCTGYDPARAAGEVVLDPQLVLEKPFAPEVLLRRLRELLAPVPHQHKG